MSDALHLWEPKHTYCCREASEQDGGHQEYESWAAFYRDYGGPPDPDGLNLLFRWDWHTADDDFPNTPDTLMLFWLRQYKGKFVSMEIKVRKSDESEIRAYLEQHFASLCALWTPLHT